MDFFGGAAGEGTAIVEHACREFGQGERTGRDAGLEGEDDLFLGLSVLGGIVGLENELQVKTMLAQIERILEEEKDMAGR